MTTAYQGLWRYTVTCLVVRPLCPLHSALQTWPIGARKRRLRRLCAPSCAQATLLRALCLNWRASWPSGDVVEVQDSDLRASWPSGDVVEVQDSDLRASWPSGDVVEVQDSDLRASWPSGDVVEVQDSDLRASWPSGDVVEVQDSDLRASCAQATLLRALCLNWRASRAQATLLRSKLARNDTNYLCDLWVSAFRDSARRPETGWVPQGL